MLSSDCGKGSHASTSVAAQQQQLQFTAHPNWKWVVRQAMAEIQQTLDNSIDEVLIDAFLKLPSIKYGTKKVRPTYALFRIDQCSSSSNSNTGEHSDGGSGSASQIPISIKKIRATSQSFAFLDPKDALFRECSKAGVAHCMPHTVLLNWDSEILPSGLVYPALLKASLGSGGFGLYFVNCDFDVLELLRCHRKKALAAPGFVDSLIHDYSAVPAWSLQELIRPVVVKTNRRCQIRAYAVECCGLLYVYDTYEARVPLWDVDLDEAIAAAATATTAHTDGSDIAAATATASLEIETRTLTTGTGTNSAGNAATTAISTLGDANGNKKWSHDVENEYCGEGHARPYNEKRNKTETERYLLHELEELNSEHVKGAVCSCVKEALTGLRPAIISRSTHFNQATKQLAIVEEVTLAVVGIDLLVSYTYESSDDNCRGVSSRQREGRSTPSGVKANIVEFNFNPAMPAEDKQMSPAYRKHLVEFVAATITLGLQAHSLVVDVKAPEGVDIIERRKVNNSHKINNNTNNNMPEDNLKSHRTSTYLKHLTDKFEILS